MIRLFIAFPIKTAIKNYLAEITGQFKPLSDNIKWIRPDNMHLTTKFLGDTDPKLVTPLIEIIQSTCKYFGPVQTSVNRIGGFPNLKRPRVIWAGLDESADSLVRVVNRLHQELGEIGIAKESKPFRPHLTLGRVKNFQGIEKIVDELEQYKFKSRKITFDRLELIQSTLTQQGPIYKTLGSGLLTERFE